MTSITCHTKLSLNKKEQINELFIAAHKTDDKLPVSEDIIYSLNYTYSYHLIATNDQKIVGYLNLTKSRLENLTTAELIVYPSMRGLGIGKALIYAGIAKSKSKLTIWARNNLNTTQTIAHSMNFMIKCKLSKMYRSLDNLPSLHRSNHIRIKTYLSLLNIKEVLKVNNAAFLWHLEQSSWVMHDIIKEYSKPWFDPDGLFVAYDQKSGKIVGFHWTKVHWKLNDTYYYNNVGEVYVLGIDLPVQMCGIGSIITLTGLKHLAKLNCKNAILYVNSNNLKAITTYKNLGFKVFSTDVAYAIR